MEKSELLRHLEAAPDVVVEEDGAGRVCYDQEELLTLDLPLLRNLLERHKVPYSLDEDVSEEEERIIALKSFAEFGWIKERLPETDGKPAPGNSTGEVEKERSPPNTEGGEDSKGSDSQKEETQSAKEAVKPSEKEEMKEEMIEEEMKEEAVKPDSERENEENEKEKETKDEKEKNTSTEKSDEKGETLVKEEEEREAQDAQNGSEDASSSGVSGHDCCWAAFKSTVNLDGQQ